MKEMCEASREWFKESPYNDNDSARTVYLGGFRGGVIWAQDEVVKKLWHDVSEEPDVRHRIIICLYKEGDISQDYEVYSEATEHDSHKLRMGEFNWICYAEENDIEKWCYKDDILPQKGGSDV